MKKIGLLLLLLAVLVGGEARADLNVFLEGLNSQASANAQDYAAMPAGVARANREAFNRHHE